MILKMPWFINPCRKCIVRACCSSVCNLYGKRVNQTHQVSSVLSIVFSPIEFLIHLYKDKKWFLFCMMIIGYIGLILQLFHIVNLFNK